MKILQGSGVKMQFTAKLLGGKNDVVTFDVSFILPFVEFMTEDSRMFSSPCF